MTDKPWINILVSGPPRSGQVVETRREGEAGTNTCYPVNWPADEVAGISSWVEWVECGTGRTTVTHSTFLPPTHYRELD